MAAKMSLLSALAVGVASLLTWGGFEAHKNQEYNKRMWEYGEWRKKFYDNELYDETYMCSSHSIQECSKQENKDRAYLPSPYEKKLWDLLLESLKANNKDIREKNMKKQGHGLQEQLTEIQNSSQLRDYCYEEVKTAINEANKEGKEKNTNYFNAGGNTNSDKKNHERCTLIGEDLKEYIKK